MNVGPRRTPVLPTVDGVWIPGGRRALRWWISGAVLVVIALGALLLTRYAGDSSRFPVLQVDVLGTLDFADRKVLTDRVQLHLEESFYMLDIDAISASLEGMPWVDRAHVRRLWPDRLMIEIDEHVPVARWNERALLAESGTVFEAPQLDPAHPRHLSWSKHLDELPDLRGAKGRHDALLEAWQRYEARLRPIGLELDRLEEDARRSQTLVLADDTAVSLGRDDRERRFETFVSVFPDVVADLESRPASFDMRYPNGFALAAGGSTETATR